MDKIKIINSELPLFWYISPIFITDADGYNKTLIVFKDFVNKTLKSYLDNKSDLEHCQTLKQFIEHKLAELNLMDYTGAYKNELTSKMKDIVDVLQSGIELGEKEQNQFNPATTYRQYDWFSEDANYDPETLEGYLKIHAREFSVPTFTLKEFLASGYYKHCLAKGWGRVTSANTFITLFKKGDTIKNYSD